MKERGNMMKEKICQTAVDLFEQYGFDHVSMRQIADACSIAVGNLTYYFPKKEYLLSDILENVETNMEDLFPSWLYPETEFLEGDIQAGMRIFDNTELLREFLWVLKRIERFQETAHMFYREYVRFRQLVPRFERISSCMSEKTEYACIRFVKALRDRKVLRKDIEWAEYENLIDIVIILTDFWKQIAEYKNEERQNRPRKLSLSERLCRLFLPYFTWEWKGVYVQLCDEICGVKIRRTSLELI